jgi:hypothetical protein
MFQGFGRIDWLAIQPWVNWAINWMGVIGVAIYGFNLLSGSPWIWRLVLVLIFGKELINIYQWGLFIPEWSAFNNFIVGIQYLILVLPLLSIQSNNHEISNVA